MNGIRGNMGVVVNKNGNHYYTHRIVLPDGTAFQFSTEKENAAQELSRGVTVSGSLADTTSAASSHSIRNSGENVNGKIYLKEDSRGRALTQAQHEFFRDSKVVDQWYEGQEFGGYQVEPLRTEQEAREAGFPVLDGVQVMPYRTWVRAMDRNNYGLVVGVSTNYAGIRMLQVSFLNKETGKRSVIAMPKGNLEVVEGLYQPGKEEMDSLERTAPPDWYEGYREEQVQNAIREAEELERNELERTTGKSVDENTRKPPEDYDPKKGEEYLKRLPRNVQNYVGKKIKDSEYKVADALGLPRVNGVEFIQDSVRTMAAEYRCQKPKSRNGSWVFRAIFQGGIQKISFPKNDLWGGLELPTQAFRGRFCRIFRKICPFFRFRIC